MVSGEVSEANAKVSVETAVERGVTVLNLHRSDVARLRRIGARLAERLEATIEGREVDGPCIGDKESVSDMLEKLSRVSTRTIQLERQAFNLDEPQDAAPATKDTSPRERINSRIRGLAARSGAGADTGGPH